MQQQPLRTTVIGSYPFPAWLEFASQHLDQFGPDDLRELQDDATLVAMMDQIAAGLDVITDGEQSRLDFNLSFYGFIEGIALEGKPPRRFGPPAHDQRGKHAVIGELRAPRGFGAVEEFQRLQRLNKAHGPAVGFTPALKSSVPGPYTLSGRLIPNESYRDRYALTEALFPLVRKELESLVAAGCSEITVDEPSMSCYAHREDPKRFVDIFNRTVESVVGKCRLSTHLCFGNYKGRAVGKREYRPMFPAFLDMKVDEIHVEMASREFAEIEIIGEIAKSKDVAVGIIDVKSYYIETPADVAERVRRCLLAERITGPLGMADTRLMPRDSQILPRLAMHHTRGPDGAWHRAHWGVVLGGEGGMVSTLEDMLTWQANLANPKVGTAEMFRAMATPAPYRNGTNALYAMGLVAAPYRGLHSVGHGGGVAGGRSESMLFQNERLGIVILGNRDDIAPYSLALRIADAALGAKMTAPRNPADLQRLAASAGVYRHEGGDDLFEIAVEAGEPIFVTNMGSAAIEQLVDRFAPERPTMHLIFSPDGTEAMDVFFCGERRRYRRLGASPPPSPHPIDGRWRHAGAGMLAEVTPDSLRLTSDFGVLSLSLAHLDGDLFIARPPGGAAARPWTCTIRATGDALLLSSDRTKQLRFVRA